MIEAGWLDKKFQPGKDVERVIIDFKNTSGIYYSHKLQTRAYQHLYQEMYVLEVDRCFILRLGTKHKAGFEFKEVNDVEFADFLHVYETYKRMNGGKIPDPPMVEEYPATLKLEGVDLLKVEPAKELSAVLEG